MYFQLEECFNNIKTDLPLSFFDKFFHINYFCVDGRINDIDGLNWFLNNMKYLTELNITNGEQLDELFFNNLPITIRKLSIKKAYLSNINCDFILKLSNFVKYFKLFKNQLKPSISFIRPITST